MVAAVIIVGASSSRAGGREIDQDQVSDGREKRASGVRGDSEPWTALFVCSGPPSSPTNGQFFA